MHKDLELSGDQMRQLVAAAMDRIVAHVEALPRMPAADTDGGVELARSLAEPLPDHGEPYEKLLALLFDKVVPKSFNTAGPGYLAYIPGGGLFHSAVADLIADSVNRYVGVFQAAPGLAQIEANVVRWFCGIVGYPAGSGGFLTTGGSLANLIALITARSERLPESFLSGAIYASEQTHHSVQKAAMLAGFPARNVRAVACDRNYRVDVEAMRGMIARDRKTGLTPFLIAGNAGTTNTGAVDDLRSLAALAHREAMWFHVDAAYGGFFLLTDRGREAMAGVELADSITLDPHKGLFLPYGTGSLLVKDAATLRRTHSLHAHYLPRMQSDDDLVDFCEISPELSRDFRGLRVWLPIKMHGADAFRKSLDEKLDLAQWAASELSRIPGIEILAGPQLSLMAFRLAPPEAPIGSLNGLNKRLLDRINARRRVYLTGTMLGDTFALRICVLSFRTHMDRMREGLEDIRDAVAELGASHFNGED